MSPQLSGTVNKAQLQSPLLHLLRCSFLAGLSIEMCARGATSTTYQLTCLQATTALPSHSAAPASCPQNTLGVSHAMGPRQSPLLGLEASIPRCTEHAGKGFILEHGQADVGTRTGRELRVRRVIAPVVANSLRTTDRLDAGIRRRGVLCTMTPILVTPLNRASRAIGGPSLGPCPTSPPPPNP